MTATSSTKCGVWIVSDWTLSKREVVRKSSTSVGRKWVKVYSYSSKSLRRGSCWTRATKTRDVMQLSAAISSAVVGKVSV